VTPLERELIAALSQRYRTPVPADRTGLNQAYAATGRVADAEAEAERELFELNYDAPWGWMQPARHALGALLLEQGHVDEAEAVYRADLIRHPHNVGALHGLAECLARQGKTAAVADVTVQLRTAAQRADVTIDRSCYCRQAGAANDSVVHTTGSKRIRVSGPVPQRRRTLS
jgi:tetratricopeptide (TPR) repeat protein